MNAECDGAILKKNINRTLQDLTHPQIVIYVSECRIATPAAALDVFIG